MLDHDTWLKAESDMSRAIVDGDRELVLSTIRMVLEHGDEEQRGRALMCRGTVREDENDWVAAATDFEAAIVLLPDASYARFTAQLSAASANEHLGNDAAAERRTLAALETCAAASEPISGAPALRRLFARPQPVVGEPLALAKRVARQSWHVLNLPGEPDLDDMPDTVRRLLDQHSRFR